MSAFGSKKVSLIHNNIRSLKRNFEDFQTHLLNELDFPFSIIGVTVTKIEMQILLILIPHWQDIILNLSQHLFEREVLDRYVHRLQLKMYDN